MTNENDPIEDWLETRRAEPVPELPTDFSNHLTQRLAITKSIIAASPRIWAMRVAAIIVIGAIGFVRMELFAFLMINSA